MPKYENKSPEELRYEDYMNNRTGKQGAKLFPPIHRGEGLYGQGTENNLPDASGVFCPGCGLLSSSPAPSKSASPADVQPESVPESASGTHATKSASSVTTAPAQSSINASTADDHTQGVSKPENASKALPEPVPKSKKKARRPTRLRSAVSIRRSKPRSIEVDKQPTHIQMSESPHVSPHASPSAAFMASASLSNMNASTVASPFSAGQQTTCTHEPFSQLSHDNQNSIQKLPSSLRPPSASLPRRAGSPCSLSKATPSNCVTAADQNEAAPVAAEITPEVTEAAVCPPSQLTAQIKAPNTSFHPAAQLAAADLSPTLGASSMSDAVSGMPVHSPAVDTTTRPLTAPSQQSSVAVPPSDAPSIESMAQQTAEACFVSTSSAFSLQQYEAAADRAPVPADHSATPLPVVEQPQSQQPTLSADGPKAAAVLASATVSSPVVVAQPQPQHPTLPASGTEDVMPAADAELKAGSSSGALTSSSTAATVPYSAPVSTPVVIKLPSQSNASKKDCMQPSQSFQVTDSPTATPPARSESLKTTASLGSLAANQPAQTDSTTEVTAPTSNSKGDDTVSAAATVVVADAEPKAGSSAGALTSTINTNSTAGTVGQNQQSGSQVKGAIGSKKAKKGGGKMLPRSAAARRALLAASLRNTNSSAFSSGAVTSTTSSVDLNSVVPTVGTS